MSKTEGSDTVTMEFTYNHAGLRTKKVKKVNGTVTETTEYILNGKNVVELIHTNHATNTRNKLHFYYDVQGRVALVDCNGTVYTYAYNLQGDVIGIVDSTGNLVVEYSYDAWGKPISTTANSTLTTQLAELNPFRYRMYVWDEETGLYYLRSRYYSCTIDRFIDADSQLSMNELLSLNQFMYCGNNPVNRTDDLGNKWWHWLVGAAVVAACAVAVVVTAGGVAAGLTAVASVASGSLAGSVSSTVAASALIGSAAVLTAEVIDSASSSSSLDEFAERGSWGTAIKTAAGGLLGAVIGYHDSKEYYSTHYSGFEAPDKLIDPPRNAYYTQLNSEGEGIKSYTRFDATGHQYWRIDYIGRAHNGIDTPHIHVYTHSILGGKDGMKTYSLESFDWSIVE